MRKASTHCAPKPSRNHLLVKHNVTYALLIAYTHAMWRSSPEKSTNNVIVLIIKFLASVPTCDGEHRVNEVGAIEPCLQLMCRLKYWGKWAPIMEWKRVPTGVYDDKNSPWIKEGVLSKPDNYSVESTLTADGSQHNDTRYVCITHFTQSQRPRSTGATNTPIYLYTWEYPAQGKKQLFSKYILHSIIFLNYVLSVLLWVLCRP